MIVLKAPLKQGAFLIISLPSLGSGSFTAFRMTFYFIAVADEILRFAQNDIGFRVVRSFVILSEAKNPDEPQSTVITAALSKSVCTFFAHNS